MKFDAKPTVTEPKSAESIASVHRKRMEALAALRAKPEDETPLPMTPERAEYFKAILAIPDRHEPTAEEREFRSKIETKLEAGQ